VSPNVRRVTDGDETQPKIRSRWRDDPIWDREQDTLHRGPFADNAADLIADIHSDSSSVVYGLEGPWGSGKSSVVALISETLTKPTDSGWQVVHFTPWATSGTDALLHEFFNVVASAAPESAEAQALRDRLTSLSGIARPLLASIPLLGAGLAEAARTIEERSQKPWNVAFQEVADELAKLGTPILVVVDDIDRLQPSELLDLLKVVRLLGRFPGVDFLLSYDELTVVETLQDPARGKVTKARARAFMEKIVQYPLSMPPLLDRQIVRMLDAGLTAIVTSARIESSFEKSRFGEIIQNTMPSQLTTPRAIGRFLAQVEEQFRVHDVDEMNEVDLILATFVRVQFPDLFASLQRWKAELTTGSSGVLYESLFKKQAPDWDKLLKTVDGNQNRKDAKDVLEALFPAVQDHNSASAAARRFAHPDYFDRYLAQTIPVGDIADHLISRALHEAAAGDPAELRELVLSPDDEQAALAMSKIRVRYPDLTEPWVRVSADEAPLSVDLLGSGMGIVESATDRTASWTSELSQSVYWMATVVRQLIQQNPGVDLVPGLEKCENIARRSHVVSAAMSDLKQLDEKTADALRALRRSEAKLILKRLIADLAAGDDSKTLTGNQLMYSTVIDAGLLPELQKQVKEGLDAGTFTVETVASRFVGFSYVVGGAGTVPSGASFSGDLFTKVTGIDAESADNVEDEPWTDTSWAHRKAFASRYITAE
jgi:hypothetical protein